MCLISLWKDIVILSEYNHNYDVIITTNVYPSEEHSQSDDLAIHTPTPPRTNYEVGLTRPQNKLHKYV